MEIGLVDYGMGNVRSVARALEHAGATVTRIDGAASLERAKAIVLPGVGAFADAMNALASRGLVEPLRQYLAADRPYLGVCLGLQLLFETGEEGGAEIEGLGALRGRVVRFTADAGRKVPHMGWNQLGIRNADALLDGVEDGAYAYFLHSYYAEPADPADVLTETDYGGAFCSAVARGAVRATQFHPEKSQALGQRILGNFVRAVSP